MAQEESKLHTHVRKAYVTPCCGVVMRVKRLPRLETGDESLRALGFLPENFAWITRDESDFEGNFGSDVAPQSIRLLADMTGHGGTAAIKAGDHDTMSIPRGQDHFDNNGKWVRWDEVAELRYPVLPFGLAKDLCDAGKCVLTIVTNVCGDFPEL
jgi:hypothetical protein